MKNVKSVTEVAPSKPIHACAYNMYVMENINML